MIERLLLLGSLPLLVAGLLIAGLGVPIPEDPLLLAAGVLSHQTSYRWWTVLPIVYVSAIGADCCLFMLARHFGAPLLARAPFRWVVTPARRVRVSQLFERHGHHAVFFGRHLPGLRAVVFAIAGIERMPFTRFVLWDGLAGLITIPVVFGLGYLFSTHVAAVQAGIAQVEHWAAAIAAVATLIGWLIWSHRRTQRAPGVQ